MLLFESLQWRILLKCTSHFKNFIHEWFYDLINVCWIKLQHHVEKECHRQDANVSRMWMNIKAYFEISLTLFLNVNGNLCVEDESLTNVWSENWSFVEQSSIYFAFPLYYACLSNDFNIRFVPNSYKFNICQKLNWLQDL